MSQTIKTNGGKILQETSANGVKGMLLRTISPEKFFFRVNHGDGSFDDYQILHDDLCVTINEDALASFYENENGEKWLDHSPNVLGWETVDSEE
ncbi:hypothetical protein BH20ACI1_BH20ACI1_12860 [soil metagenome]